MYNSEVSNSNTNLTSTSEEVEDDDKDYEDDNVIKSPPQKSKTYDLQSYSGPGSIISSSFFSSSASMINLLGDGSVSGKEASLDYDRKCYNILLLDTLNKHYKNCEVFLTHFFFTFEAYNNLWITRVD